MLNNSAPGDAVYEPFCGSGSTIVAAETTGRVCHAMDLDARYVDVAVRRWQTFTSRVAVLAGEDRIFNDVAMTRASACSAADQSNGAGKTG
jgi:DNA modification methylase